MKSILLVVLLLSICSCELNARQEKSLNRAIVQYQNAYNKSLTLLEVSLTHPCVIEKYYQDSAQLRKNFIHQGSEIYNYNIISVASNPEAMQVKIEFELSPNDVFDKKTLKKTMYAFSYDKGDSWYFIQANLFGMRNCKHKPKKK